MSDTASFLQWIRAPYTQEVSIMILIVALAGTSLIVACSGFTLQLAAAIKGH